MNNVLITGASGLAGREISRVLKNNGYNVWGTYHKNRVKEIDINWLYSDFSNLKGVRDFLNNNKNILKNIDFIIHAYGPIIFKDIKELKSEDFIKDFFDNTVVSYEVLKFLLNNSNLKKAIFFGFHEVGNHKPYKKILTYTIAKNSLLDMIVSLKEIYNDVDFKILSFTQIEGADYEVKSLPSIPSKELAKEIFKLLKSRNFSELIIKSEYY